jgi:hypothetical protein
MQKKIITLINLTLAGTAACLILLAAFFALTRPNEIVVVDEASFKGSMPKNAFAHAKDSYDAIKDPFLSLKYHPMSAQLPDLKKTLIFYGKNGRPDAMLTKPHLHFSFNGNKTISAAFPGEKLYLTYNKLANPPHYTFSKDNQTTSLWVEADIQDDDALVKVFMKNENNELIQEPPHLATFQLKATTQNKFGTGVEVAEIGNFRVDGSLLARQKAKWHGCDRFLEKHGGEEFVSCLGKQRIDFGEESQRYSVFVSIGDCLIWDQNRWKVVNAGTESLSNHLLVVKKVDDRLINFELWDVEGKNKIVLNLIKAHEPNHKQTFDDTFKFVGARTRSQFVFEVDDERMLLRPKDWLVLTDDGWKKITTAEEIDAYVERKLAGPLFVFDGIVKKDDRQVFYGTMFNTSRTDMQPIELPIHQGSSLPSSIENNQQKDENTLENPVAKTHY